MSEVAVSRANKLEYIPALDGLRAVAVSAVMVYHGFLGWGTGGFLGVDLFFVISGYLITTLLLKEVEGTGTVALGQFWMRRAKRLLPALFAVLCWVIAYASVVATPAELSKLRGDALATLAYVANWRFIFAQESYFDQFLEPSPLGHMWSLAIEEQWYLLWPLVILGIGVATHRSKRKALPLPHLAIGALAISVASAGLMAVLVLGKSDTSRAYYGTDARVQALLIGVALAFWLAANPGGTVLKVRGVPLSELLGFVGALGFLGCFLLVEDSDRWMYFGGFWLTAAISASLVFAAVGHEGYVRRALSRTPLLWIGRISYGLYLWHWPLYILLTPERTGISGPTLFVLRLAASLGVALVSYLAIEAPARNRATSPRLVAGGALSCVAGLVVALLVVTAPGQSAPSLNPDQAVAYSDDATPVLILGDSVYSELAALFPRTTYPDLAVHSAAVPGCGIITAGNTASNVSCLGAREHWNEEADLIQPEVFVIALSAWDIQDRTLSGAALPFGDGDFADFLFADLDDTVTTLRARHPVPILFVNVACAKFNAGELISNRNDRIDWLNDRLAEYVGSRSAIDAHLVDIHSWACPEGVYADERDGVALHRDGTHYTEEAAQNVWAWLAPQIQGAGSS